ncbi:hypothetical protein C2869_01110 [Saccharobesus litoralis]|uniref:Uncharacterized protein n=2 Tax=Saccharobesus litoralis TaxID=2172099 RepID=A0A2S0VLN4_9ALTE|nr:hypothetical protein C2869_01110 [Saccharobesus litoralis]
MDPYGCKLTTQNGEDCWAMAYAHTDGGSAQGHDIKFPGYHDSTGVISTTFNSGGNVYVGVEAAANSPGYSFDPRADVTITLTW